MPLTNTRPGNPPTYDRVFKQFSLTQQKLRNFDPNTARSMDWFYSVARTAHDLTVNPRQIMRSDTARLYPVKDIKVGELLFYFYDPKYAEELPFYDQFPLVFPFSLRTDGQGFFGINLHYLYPRDRLELIRTLQPYKDGVGERAKLLWNYGVLKSIAGSNITSNAVKQYLFSHVQSRAFRVPYGDWPMAAMLPVERFVKSDKHQVWARTSIF